MRLRIISGIHGARTIDSPPGNRTQPMGEKIRGALFNVLGDIKNLSVLDAYSGSGAVAIEAYSRGAAPVYAVDVDKKAVDTIKANMQKLNINDNFFVSQLNITTWLQAQDSTFDVIICDPPYDQVQTTTMQIFANFLAVNGTLVISWPAHTELPQMSELKVHSVKRYGNAQLAFYKSS